MQAEREKPEAEDCMTNASVEKTALDRSLARLESENTELRQHVETLHAQLGQVEKDHSRRSRLNTYVL